MCVYIIHWMYNLYAFLVFPHNTEFMSSLRGRERYSTNCQIFSKHNTNMYTSFHVSRSHRLMGHTKATVALGHTYSDYGNDLSSLVPKFNFHKKLAY